MLCCAADQPAKAILFLAATCTPVCVLSRLWWINVRSDPRVWPVIAEHYPLESTWQMYAAPCCSCHNIFFAVLMIGGFGNLAGEMDFVSASVVGIDLRSVC